MAKRVKVNLFGKNGQRSLEIQPRGGFPTRHIKVPVEPVPSIFSPVTPEMVAADQKAKRRTPQNTVDREPSTDNRKERKANDGKRYAISAATGTRIAIDPAAALEVLQKMTQAANPRAVDHDWFIIDEILFVATTQFKIRANHTTLLAALRELYRHGRVDHKTNRFDQHMFKWVGDAQKTDLHALLAAVDAILGGTPDA